MIEVAVVSAKTAGVFHLQSPSGKYKMNFSQADAACKNEGATLATFKQLGDAQQVFPSTDMGTNGVKEITTLKMTSWSKMLP